MAKEDWALTSDVEGFIRAIGRHRNWDRSADPALV
jgi:hypothetical protein